MNTFYLIFGHEHILDIITTWTTN